MKASIITIGDEILIGQILDTNSKWIAEKLEKNGAKVDLIMSVSDTPEAIKNALDYASKCDLVIVTGGLGPTEDDRTKRTLSEYFSQKLVRSQEQLKAICQFFETRNLPRLNINDQQADVLAEAEILINEIGTAPGMILKKKNTYFVFLPGVPFEMKHLFQGKVQPFIQKNFEVQTISHKTVLIHGIGESFLAEKIKNWEKKLPQEVKLAYLPSLRLIRLRLSSYAPNIDETLLMEHFEALKQIVPEYYYGEFSDNLEKELHKTFLKKELSLSLAESCTGGYVSHLITSLSGASKYYKGAVVSYSNEIKKSFLNISSQKLKTFGAVSKEIVTEMAKNVKQKMGTDCSIAISGIAGPNGGTEEKPVGTIWVCVNLKDIFVVKNLKSHYKNRERNIIHASQMALLMLLKLLKEQ